MELGKHLAELRKKYKYKQTDIAEKLNISQQVVSNIERGVTVPDIGFLKGVADIYGISLDELVGRDFSGGNKDSIEEQIMGYLKQLDPEGKALSLGLISQVAQSRDNNGK